MKHRVFFFRLFIACGLIWRTLAQADDYLQADQLRDQIVSYLETHLAGEYAGVNADDIHISVSGLDPRLRLHDCGQALDKTVSSPRPYGNNLSVKVSCGGARPWTIYVPARVDVYAEVVVLAHSLERGALITADDIQTLRMNTAQAGFGHIREPERVLGMQLRRRLGAGEAVRLSHVQQPQIVRRGDRVILEAATGGVSVVTTGRAMSDGQVGDQIRVRNEKSNRVVDAEITAPGRARIQL